MCGNIHTHQHELFEICVLTLSFAPFAYIKAMHTHTHAKGMGGCMGEWVGVDPKGCCCTQCAYSMVE
jgi:hypothetical protein